MTASSSTSHIKRYKPYCTPAEVERLSAKQRGKLSVSREERARQQACGFLDAVGVRCGFPRKTIATAQTLYMRFHLFFPYKDFNYLEVALSTLYVSSKLHDTLKKPRDIILTSYAIRFPQLVKKGVVDPSAVDPSMLESERKRVLSIERLVLETMCFKFSVEVGLGMVVKLGKALGVSKEICQHAWRVAVDCHRSPAPLSFPPHVIALGSLYAAALLVLCTVHAHAPASEDLKEEQLKALEIVQFLGSTGSWESEYSATWGQIDDVTHSLLDLYITILSMPISDPSFISSPSPISPKEQPTAPQTSGGSNLNTAYRLPTFWNPQTLTELKIHLRDRRPGVVASLPWPEEGDDAEDISEGMGKNDGTVRFIWDAEVAVE